MTDTHFDASSSTPSGESRPPESRIDRERAVALAPAVSAPMLEIVDETASTNTDLMQRMKAMPTQDDAFGSHRIREDGLFITPSYLFQVKGPAESKGPWDYYKQLAETPEDKAWKPLAEGGCNLVHS